MGELSFEKDKRLLKAAHFENVFENAVPAVSPQLTLLARKNSHSSPRLGITLPKKRVKKAVDRNRLKRLIRESFRHRANTLPKLDIVVIGKSGLAELTNEELTRLLRKLWNKLEKRCS